MIQHVADAFTVAAVLTGLWAAFLWWCASKLPLDPDYKTPEPTYDQLPPAIGILARTIEATAANVIRGSGLNRRAALWTAASVALQTLASVFGRFVMP